MTERSHDGAAGALAWADDAARSALARRLYDRVMGLCRGELAAHHVPLLTQAIDEALDGEATAARIAVYDGNTLITPLPNPPPQGGGEQECRANADAEALAVEHKKADVESVSRPAAGRTAAATSERMDATAGETAPFLPPSPLEGEGREGGHSSASARLIDLHADGLPGDRVLIIDFVRVLLAAYGFAAERIDDGVRPKLEIIVEPRMETYLRALGLPQDNTIPAHLSPPARAEAAR